MKRARGNEQNMIGIDRAIFRTDHGAFDQRQQIALYTFAADITATRIAARADFINFIQKHDAIFLHRFDRSAGDTVII